MPETVPLLVNIDYGYNGYDVNEDGAQDIGHIIYRVKPKDHAEALWAAAFAYDDYMQAPSGTTVEQCIEQRLRDKNIEFTTERFRSITLDISEKGSYDEYIQNLKTHQICDERSVRA